MTVLRTLGAGGPSISPLGFGSWALGGGDWGLGWGAQDDAQSVLTLRRAVELGIDWIDTAAVYGLGHSEEIVGRAVKEMPASERPRVFTKCGLVWDAGGRVRHCLEPQSIRDELEASLRRLGVSVIDLYQIHWPVYPPDRPAPDIERAWETLNQLAGEGKVRHIGVSNFDVAQLRRIEPLGPVLSLQSPYSLARRSIEAEILAYTAARTIGVLVYSPLQSGLLTGKMTRERLRSLPAGDWRKTKSADFQEPRLSANLAIADRLRALAARRGDATPAQLAVAWTLRNPAVTGAIVGARSPEQIEELAPAAALRLSGDEARELEG